MKRPVVIALVVVLVLVPCIAFLQLTGMFLPQHKGDLDGFMQSRLDAMNVPGMAAGIVSPDGLVWEGYYGTYDGESPFSKETLFNIASVSKTVVATAAMQLWEQGRFDLDDDINDYLDFDVRNPSHPEQAITFRHLMTHRSTISDRQPFYDEMYTIESGGGDSPWEMREFMPAYLSPNGEFYSSSNYIDAAPGETFEYSNYGTALLAHLVEVISGEDFAQYCRAHIFLPLGMEHTYYLLSEIPASETELASAFRDGEPLPYYNYPDYPAGSLRTTIRDFSRFAAFYLEPAAQKTAILQPETIEVMFGQYGESTDMGEDQMGLLWVHMDWVFFESIGHTGADPGVNAFLLLSPQEGYATILAMNGNPENYLLMRATLERLWQEGQRLTSGR